MKQAEDAAALLAMLRERVLGNGDPVIGYSAAAHLIGRGSKEGVHLGQVCSRIDLACFNAGLPLLSMHWVRKPKGNINPAGFVGWETYEEELARHATSHHWTDADFSAVASELAALPDKGAKSLWNGITELGEPAIRKQLHCKVRDTQRNS